MDLRVVCLSSERTSQQVRANEKQRTRQLFERCITHHAISLRLFGCFISICLCPSGKAYLQFKTGTLSRYDGTNSIRLADAQIHESIQGNNMKTSTILRHLSRLAGELARKSLHTKSKVHRVLDIKSIGAPLKRFTEDSRPHKVRLLLLALRQVPGDKPEEGTASHFPRAKKLRTGCKATGQTPRRADIGVKQTARYIPY